MTDAKTISRTCLATQARRASRALTRRYDRALTPFDLRITQFSVLIAASLVRDDRSIQDVADALGLERSTLSRNLAPLVRRGLITLGPERKHRARAIRLTEAGAALLEEAKASWAAVQKETETLLGRDFEPALASLQRLSSLE